MRAEASTEDVWREAIELFRAAYRGDQLAGQLVLDTTADSRRLIEGLLQLLQVHLIDAGEASVSKFLAIAESAGPPPRYGARPMPTVRSQPFNRPRTAS